MRGLKIAVVGASGVVGEQMLKSLEEMNINVEKLVCYTSKRSAGKTITFQGKPYTYKELNEDSIDFDLDYALFSAGKDTALHYAPLFANKHVRVIDNSSAFRMHASVPLLVPEVNLAHVTNNDYLIANPNCSTIQAMLPLKVLLQLSPLKRVVYSTYQAVSGSGIAGIADLNRGLANEAPTFYPKPIVHNVIPLIDVLLPNGNTKEEEKMIQETRKILDLPDLKVSATCVRVPVFNGHAVSLNVECASSVSLEAYEEALQRFPGIRYLRNGIPTPLDVSGQDLVYVGRLRRDESVEHGFNLWVVADNIRKGAASNAVGILKALEEETV